MRLLNVQSLALELFDNSNLPAYAILSHTWDKPFEEVTFKDITDPAVRGQKPGFNKIVQCCRLAQQDGFHYVWIDTCCIDKENAGELTETINSMYYSYQESSVCYVFLSDRDRGQEGDEPVKGLDHCRWFTRGWTLQELLAPNRVEFYDLMDGNTNSIGTRDTLAEQISKITRIHRRYLDKTSSILEASVAQRMSWVSKRQTTKPEDMAYCLLGLFDISLSLFRGGSRTIFQHLQEKIIARSNDESIFAWTAANGNEPRGMLASWPSEFEHSGHIRSNNFHRTRPPYTVTNRGLEFHNPSRSLLGLGTRWMRQSIFISGTQDQKPRTHFLRLNCEDEAGRLVSISIRRDPTTETFYRVEPSKLDHHEPERGLQLLAILYGVYETIYIQQPRPLPPSSPLPRSLFSFDTLLLSLSIHSFSALFLLTSLFHREPLHELNFFLGWAYLNFGWKVLGQSFYFWVGALAVGLARPRPWSRGMVGALLVPGVVGGLIGGLARVRRGRRGRRGRGREVE